MYIYIYGIITGQVRRVTTCTSLMTAARKNATSCPTTAVMASNHLSRYGVGGEQTSHVWMKGGVLEQKMQVQESLKAATQLTHPFKMDHSPGNLRAPKFGSISPQKSTTPSKMGAFMGRK